jgi:glycosyl transferase family 25
MDKDVERLKYINQECIKNNIIYERFPGIDINNLSQSDLDKYVTKFAQKNFTNGMIGCAISHLKIYEDIINKGYKNALILEDDIVFDKNFHSILKNSFDELPSNYDILYLGSLGLSSIKPYYDINILLKFYTIFNHKYDDKYKYIYRPEFPLGTFGYIISNQGCNKLLQYINKIYFHIDWMICFNINKLNIYGTKTKIIHQKWNNSNNSDMYATPKYFNCLLNNITDQNNVPYSYYFNFPMIKILNINITYWIIIFFILGYINNIYISYIILFYLIINFNIDIFISFLLGIIIKFYIENIKLY